jgi:hypothetical protein
MRKQARAGEAEMSGAHTIRAPELAALKPAGAGRGATRGARPEA